MTRVGTYRYIPWTRFEEFMRRGWLPVADLGPVHGEWSFLAWHCSCEEVDP